MTLSQWGAGWGDSAYQKCGVDRQGAYDYVMAQKGFGMRAMHAAYNTLLEGGIGCHIPPHPWYIDTTTCRASCLSTTSFINGVEKTVNGLLLPFLPATGEVGVSCAKPNTLTVEVEAIGKVTTQTTTTTVKVPEEKQYAPSTKSPVPVSNVTQAPIKIITTAQPRATYRRLQLLPTWTKAVVDATLAVAAPGLVYTVGKEYTFFRNIPKAVPMIKGVDVSTPPYTIPLVRDSLRYSVSWSGPPGCNLQTGMLYVSECDGSVVFETPCPGSFTLTLTAFDNKFPAKNVGLGPEYDRVDLHTWSFDSKIESKFPFKLNAFQAYLNATAYIGEFKVLAPFVAATMAYR